MRQISVHKENKVASGILDSVYVRSTCDRYSSTCKYYLHTKIWAIWQNILYSTHTMCPEISKSGGYFQSSHIYSLTHTYKRWLANHHHRPVCEYRDCYRHTCTHLIRVLLSLVSGQSCLHRRDAATAWPRPAYHPDCCHQSQSPHSHSHCICMQFIHFLTGKVFLTL